MSGFSPILRQAAGREKPSSKFAQDVHKARKAAMHRAGIDGRFFGAHAIRHSVATLIADAGVELRRVQRLLGHEDFSTTNKIYAAYSRSYLTKTVKVVDNIWHHVNLKTKS